MLSSRNNLMFAPFAGLLLWATQWAFAIEAWRARAGVRVPQWLDAIGEFEALLALSAFAVEHPDHQMPVVDAGGPSRLCATNLAHPLLGTTAVPNDVTLDAASGPALLIVSGAIAIIPGPNVLAYYLLFRVVGHLLSWQGARRAATHVAWTYQPDENLGELAQLVDMPRDKRAHRVAEIAERLKLARLAAFFDRVAVPST